MTFFSEVVLNVGKVLEGGNCLKTSFQICFEFGSSGQEL